MKSPTSDNSLAICKLCGSAISRTSRPNGFERLFTWLFRTVRCWRCNRRYYLFGNKRLVLAWSQHAMPVKAHIYKNNGPGSYPSQAPKQSDVKSPSQDNPVPSETQ